MIAVHHLTVTYDVHFCIFILPNVTNNHMCLPRHNSDVFVSFFQTVVLAHNCEARCDTEYVTDLTESVDMVVSQALKEILLI